MNAATQLIERIKANDDAGALEVLRAHPEAARERSEAGESPVLVAVYYGKSALASQIAEYAELDLCEAAALGNVERLAALLEYGASHAERSFDGWTPLHLAAFFGKADGARLLLDNGAELEAISHNSTANTPLCAALAGQADPAFIQLLIARKANVNARLAHGLAPLHIAASRGATDLIALLLDAGANPAVAMDDGVTPAAMAAQRGHDAAAALLSSRASTKQ